MHNGYLDALTSGGLVYGLPLLAVAAAAALTLLRFGWPALRAPRSGDAGLRAGVAVAGLVLLAQSAVDFDWVYPSLCALLGALAGLAYAGNRRGGGTRSVPAAVPAWLALAALALPLALGTVAPLHDRWRAAFHPTAATLDGRVRQTLDAASGPLPDPRLAASTLRACVRLAAHGQLHLAVAPGTARRALAATAGLARLDPTVAMERAVTLVSLGEFRAGLAQASRLVRADGAKRPYLYADEALAVATAGDRAAAQRIVEAELRRLPAETAPGADVAYLRQVLQAVRG